MVSSYLGSIAAVMSEAIKPGATALHVMPLGANSRATVFVRPRTPACINVAIHEDHTSAQRYINFLIRRRCHKADLKADLKACIPTIKPKKSARAYNGPCV